MVIVAQADAAFDTLILPSEVDLEAAKEKYETWITEDYQPNSIDKRYLTFAGYLKEKYLARDTTDDELEVFIDC